MASIFITGNSMGLGLGLTRYYLDRQNKLYTISRSSCPIKHTQLHHAKLDLSQLQDIEKTVSALLPPSLDLVILNAGILAEIKDLADTSLQEIQRVMDINVWANKILIDTLIKNQTRVKQLILMSSGASVNGNRGWGAYSISKASLNMMAKLYAHEMPHTHITAFAPGLVHTRMQDYLCNDVDEEKFPSIKHLKQAYRSEHMPGIYDAAQRIAESFKYCYRYDSGSFVDIRQL